MSFVKGTWNELMGPLDNAFEQRTGIREVEMGSPKKPESYWPNLDDVYNQMNQQMAGAQQQIGNLGGLLGPTGNIGGAYGHQQQTQNPYINNSQLNTIPFPGLIKAFDFLKDKAKDMAIMFGFEYELDTDCFKHKNGGFVSRRMIEDAGESLEKIFKRALTPNIHWLEDRVNEIRVRL